MTANKSSEHSTHRSDWQNRRMDSSYDIDADANRIQAQHEDTPTAVPASPRLPWSFSSRRHRVDPYNYNNLGTTLRRNSISQLDADNPNILYRSTTQQTARSVYSSRQLPQLHPLLQQSASTRNPSVQTNPSTIPSNVLSSTAEYGLTVSILRALQAQGQRFADLLTGHPRPRHPPSKQDPASHRWGVILLSLFVLFYAIYHPHTQKKLNHLTEGPEWKWNKQRNLSNRQCSMNLFIEKQEKDEFNPDFKEDKKKPPKAPKLEKNSHRTEGQALVIKRFIGAVADSFRSNKNIFQHLIFANSRDNGELAQAAMGQWPPRGSFRTQVHVLSAAPNAKKSLDGLEYGPLQGIEETFQNHANAKNVHIYDHQGQRAGLKPTDADDDEYGDEFMIDDDNTAMDFEELIQTDDDAIKFNETLKYPHFKKLLQPLMEEYDEIEHVVPYLHVDGENAKQQMHVLESARSLLMTNSIVTVGVEHAPNLDVWELIDFFKSVNYKTFMLGKRQTARIDHLCPEILQDILNHPHLKREKKTWIRSTLEYFKILKQKPPTDNMHLMPDHFQTPPFFVAMPRGRRSKEEMTIQHMYDLFGGLGGGGGQIATANDRKAPGKKK